MTHDRLAVRAHGETSATGSSSQPDVRLQPMTVRHLRGVVAVEAATSSRPWPGALFARELEDPASRRYVVACRPSPASLASRLDPRVVGFAGVHARPDAAHVTTVAVDPAFQGRGLGRRLLDWVLEAAVGLDATAITLEVRASNAVARRLYTRLGFVEVGMRPRYYQQPDEDAVMMRRELGDGRAGR